MGIKPSEGTVALWHRHSSLALIGELMLFFLSIPLLAFVIAGGVLDIQANQQAQQAAQQAFNSDPDSDYYDYSNDYYWTPIIAVDLPVVAIALIVSAVDLFLLTKKALHPVWPLVFSIIMLLACVVILLLHLAFGGLGSYGYGDSDYVPSNGTMAVYWIVETGYALLAIFYICMLGFSAAGTDTMRKHRYLALHSSGLAAQAPMVQQPVPVQQPVQQQHMQQAPQQPVQQAPQLEV